MKIKVCKLIISEWTMKCMKATRFNENTKKLSQHKIENAKGTRLICEL